MKRYKILMTGGHVTPALALIDVLKERAPEIEIVFVGRKYNNQEHTESFEYREVLARNIRFIHLQTGRSPKSLSLESLQNLINIPRGMWNSWKIISDEKPHVIMSFGGYIAMPVTSTAYIKGVPIFTHEQTIHPGLANQSIARRAEKVFVSFPEAAGFFPEEKVIVSGNPVRTSIFHQGKQNIPKQNLPCVYVTGGSLGAHAVNRCIEKILPKLLEHAYVIHQTGNVAEFQDFERLSEFKSRLQPTLQARYDIRTHVSDEEIGSVFAAADVVVGRSGANTFFELVALQKPAVCIPLPHAAFDEQRKHAHILQESGAAEVFEQNEDADQLLESILRVLKNKSLYEKGYKTITKRYKTREAASVLAEALIDWKNS